MNNKQTPLDIAWAQYCNQVYKYAEEKFNRWVKPYCKRRNYKFSAGMGTWVITDKFGEHLRDEELPNTVYYALVAEVGGFEQDLGSLMPSYKPEEEE